MEAGYGSILLDIKRTIKYVADRASLQHDLPFFFPSSYTCRLVEMSSLMFIPKLVVPMAFCFRSVYSISRYFHQKHLCAKVTQKLPVFVGHNLITLQALCAWFMLDVKLRSITPCLSVSTAWPGF